MNRAELAQRRARILAMLRAGKSFAVVAKKFNVSESLVKMVGRMNIEQPAGK